jgi:hypothetical protein
VSKSPDRETYLLGTMCDEEEEAAERSSSHKSFSGSRAQLRRCIADCWLARRGPGMHRIARSAAERKATKTETDVRRQSASGDWSLTRQGERGGEDGRGGRPPRSRSLMNSGRQPRRGIAEVADSDPEPGSHGRTVGVQFGTGQRRLGGALEQLEDGLAQRRGAAPSQQSVETLVVAVDLGPVGDQGVFAILA